MDKIIHINNSYPFYAHYFHAVSLSEPLNIFNTDDQGELGSVIVVFNPKYESVDLIKDRIKPLKDNETLKSEGKELLIPIRGLLILPENGGIDKIPLVLIGHGNHNPFVIKDHTPPNPPIKGKIVYDFDNEVPSYLGYQALQKHLAKHGVASYSINLNIVNALTSTEDSAFEKLALDANQRVLLFFLHLMLLKIIAGESVIPTTVDEYPIKFLTAAGLIKLDEALTLSTSSNDPGLQELKVLRDDLAGRIDFEKLGFMGHSRGADAVSRISSYFYKKDNTSPGPTFPNNTEVVSRMRKIAEFIGRPSQDFIKCILALEPTSAINKEDPSKHGYVIDNDQTTYFAVAGTHDEDVTLDSVRIYEYPECPKAMVVLNGATHKRFNSVWRGLANVEEAMPEVLKHRLLSNDQHDMISESLLAGSFIASLTDLPFGILFYYTFITHTLPLPFQVEIDFQTAWKFGFPSQSSPKVFKELDNKIAGVPIEQLKGKEYKFEQEEVKTFYIEKDNSGSSTIEIPINPNADDENLSKYTHFSFRFAKGYDLSSDPARIEYKNFTIQLFENDSPMRKLIAGEDIDTITLQAYRAMDLDEDTGERKPEYSILLQTVEIKLSDFFIESELNRVSRIEITVIPDKTKLPPLSTTKVIGGSLAGGVLGASFGSLGALIVVSKLGEEEQKKASEIAIYAAAGGFVIGGLVFFKILKADENAFVFKDFLLTNRQIAQTIHV